MGQTISFRRWVSRGCEAGIKEKERRSATPIFQTIRERRTRGKKKIRRKGMENSDFSEQLPEH
eukprot:5265019-Amphidinium_carterae.1